MARSALTEGGNAVLHCPFITLFNAVANLCVSSCATTLQVQWWSLPLGKAGPGGMFTASTPPSLRPRVRTTHFFGTRVTDYQSSGTAFLPNGYVPFVSWVSRECCVVVQFVSLEVPPEWPHRTVCPVLTAFCDEVCLCDASAC